VRGPAVYGPHANLGFKHWASVPRPCWDKSTMLWPPDGG